MKEDNTQTEQTNTENTIVNKVRARIERTRTHRLYTRVTTHPVYRWAQRIAKAIRYYKLAERMMDGGFARLFDTLNDIIEVLTALL